MRILLFTPPFSNHLNMLKYYKDTWINNNETLLVITGWSNIEPKINLNENNIKHLNVSELNNYDPLVFTLDRVYELTNKCIKIAKKFKPQLIIYDYMSIEGYITGRSLSVPYFCSIPSIIGPYIKDSDKFISKLDRQMITKIYNRYNINLLECNIQQISNKIFIPSDVNILWAYSDIINCDDYLRYRRLNKDNFINIGLPNILSHITCSKTKQIKKIIYISFGKFITDILYLNNSGVKKFIAKIYKYIVDYFKNNDNYSVIVISSKTILPFQLPNNFKVYESDDFQILQNAYIHITHCSPSALELSINYNIPVIGIPFFGDQHLIGHKINKLKLGIAFTHNNYNENIYIDNNTFSRKSLTRTKFKNAINHIIENYIDYRNSINSVLQNSDIDLILKKYFNYPINWNNGDLLYGNDNDKTNYLKYFKLQNDFRITTNQPFTKTFYDKLDTNLLPKSIEMYINGFIDSNYYPIESSSKFEIYSSNIKEFRTWLLDNNKFLGPIQTFDELTEDNKIEVIKNICLGGIEFFTRIKKYRIHYILEKHSIDNNLLTPELEYIKNNWKRIKEYICFYKLDTPYGIFKKINPSEYNLL
jgi:hypothetical protein